MTQMNIEEAAAVNPSPTAERHIQQYLSSDGQDVDHPAADSLILLYTTGRKSGTTRRVPVGAFPYGESLVVIGSNAGRPSHPGWYLNALAKPTVWVRNKGDFYEATATLLEPGERKAFWDDLTTRIPMFADYQARSGRELPVVRLTPLENAGDN